MRVVAGKHKGRRLKEPEGQDLRPTPARVREALLAILAHRTRDARVLDLYAGTGALGLEALSRGARQVVFVDNHVASTRILRENVTRCEYDDQCIVITQDVETFLASSPSFGEPPAFDLVFADPPYHTTDLGTLLERLSMSGKTAAHGLVILEHFFKHAVPSRIGALTQMRQSRYGDTMLTFYRRTTEDTCD
ncbi:MAG: 16S rRNA (guanine(966)-N(2))-methyltransferase RsmD [Nitrospira sp.]|nr:16S rRNA (guanine(966)-N(2))-methyltransferase RsmD [Nitrospira sp.]